MFKVNGRSHSVAHFLLFCHRCQHIGFMQPFFNPLPLVNILCPAYRLFSLPGGLRIIEWLRLQVKSDRCIVSTLGASNYTYVEACENQRQESWLMAHVRAFEFFSGVPELLVSDNQKAAVTRADRYEPVLNENYLKLARHYNTAVIPARPRKPRDKPKVENAVLVVERWILMRLMHETFHTLAALNLWHSVSCYRS